MGVRRAMEMVLAEANKAKSPIYTYGPLIHNSQVIKLLESKGVSPVKDTNGLEEGTVVIRAHGVSPEQRRLLKASGLRLIDATCPRVARVQSIIRYHTKKGYTGIIVGNRDHPEVMGLVGYGNGRCWVISGSEEVSQLPDADEVFVVAQTTQMARHYKEILKAIHKRFPEALVFDTICDATYSRQQEVRSFAGHVNGVVVVGGYHSGNTQRLVQVAEAENLKVFHVETEKDLDKERLAAMEVIGLTAGASTPNWMIRGVVKEIEAIRSRGETRPGRWAKQVFKFLLLNNVLVALGAFSLAHAAAILAGRTPDLIHPSLAFFYIYAMHVLNRFLDKGASTYNDPERAAFYKKHKAFLIVSGMAATIGALVLSFRIGTSVFFAMMGLSLLGIIYSIPIVPASLRHLWKYSKIKDIPGSKTLSEALAWAAVIALIPLLEPVHRNWPGTLVSALVVFAMVYVRSALFDIFQVQGDLIVGVETLPITLGEKRTLILLKGVILSGALIMAVAALFHLVSPFSYLLELCFMSLTTCILAYERSWLYLDNRFEALVEGNFFLAGLLGLAWYLFS
jgi:4-hydroxy-3-methylbut-2-enyl diphosphate reductase